jgi:hypothetical protein
MLLVSAATLARHGQRNGNGRRRLVRLADRHRGRFAMMGMA